MRLGYKITQNATDHLLARLAPDLRSDSPLFICSVNKMRPLVDRLIVTDHRLLAVLQSDGKVKWDVARSEVRNIEPSETWQNLTFQMTDGSSMKFGVVRPEDQREILAIFNGSAGATLDLPNTASHEVPTSAPVANPSVAQGTSVGDKAKDREAKEAAKQAKRDDRAAQRREKRMRIEREHDQRKADRQQKKQVAEERQRVLARQAGQQVLSATFGGRQVTLFANGFVTVGMGFGQPKYEKLVAIKADRAVQDKSTGGRALAATATMGVSTLYSNENFKTFLTIVTEDNTFSLQAHGARTYKVALSLATAGTALLESAAKGTPPSAAAAPTAQITPPTTQATGTSSTPASDLATQLRDLAALHEGGVLSDEEFAAAKARVLGDA